VNKLAVLGTIVLAFAAASPAAAGLGTTTGRERGLWTHGRYAVVVARVGSVADLDVHRDAGTHAVVLEPLATLAGALDPGVAPQLSARLYVGGTGTTIRSAPPAGATVLAVLQLPEKPEQEAFIVSDICTFMPDRASLVVVDGVGDARVAATVARLRAARTPPTTAPAPTEANSSRQ
jgi:hypothetical protein